MTTAPETAVIRVSFDIEQISSYAIWSVSEDRGRNPYSSLGRHAGAVHFRKDERVLVEVVGFGRPGLFVDMDVLDAMIYTVPHTDGERRSPPSPFSRLRATTPVHPWAPAEVEHVDGKRITMTQISRRPLVVVEENGRWMFSLILTMAIEHWHRGARRREIRVFTFDPEIQVGSGTEPPRGSSGQDGLTHSG